MDKLFIEDLLLKGKRVLMRVDFNVPLDGDQHVVDATRIEAALPSIKYVIDKGGKLILMSHLGRPDHQAQSEFSLAPVAHVLSAILNKQVPLAPNCIGYQVEDLIDRMQEGDVLLLENLRFHRAEEFPEEDPSFAKTLASYGDFYVNEAFGTAHRKHSSTYTICEYFPGKAAAGYLMEKEIRFLGEALKNPKRPFVSLIGGSKISSKIGVLKALLEKADKLLIGGGMSYTFLKAKGIEIGNSLLEGDFISFAKELLETWGEKIDLPSDALIAEVPSNDAKPLLCDLKNGIPSGFQGFDIGPATIKAFEKEIDAAETLLWNGPVGVYELEPFEKGSLALAKAIGRAKVTSIIGGGDTIAVISKAEVTDKITHISTGGGATLEYIEYGTLPGIEALSDKVLTL